MALALCLLSARRPRRVEVVKTAAPPPAAHAAAHFAAARSQRGDEDVVLNQKRMVFFWKGNPLPNQHSTPFSSPTLGETSLFHRGVHIVRRCSTKSTDWIRQKLASLFGARKPARHRRRGGEVPAHGRPVALQLARRRRWLLTPPLLRVAFRVPRLLFLCRLSVFCVPLKLVRRQPELMQTHRRHHPISCRLNRVNIHNISPQPAAYCC